MLSSSRGAAALLLLALAGACPAQTVAPPAPAAPASAASAALPQKHVIEDDKVRIEETRLRGQAQRITVQSKVAGARPYEVLLPPSGKDPSQDKGAAGKSTWSLFDF